MLERGRVMGGWWWLALKVGEREGGTNSFSCKQFSYLLKLSIRDISTHLEHARNWEAHNLWLGQQRQPVRLRELDLHTIWGASKQSPRAKIMITQTLLLFFSIARNALAYFINLVLNSTKLPTPCMINIDYTSSEHEAFGIYTRNISFHLSLWEALGNILLPL